MTWQFAAAIDCCPDRPILATIEAFHHAGIAAVELAPPPRHYDPWPHETVRAIRNRLRQLKMEPVAIHAPCGGPLDLTDPNPHHRHAAVGAILSAAAAVRELGGSRVVVQPCDVTREGQNVAERLERGAAALAILARACRQMSVTLLVETPLPHVIGGRADEFGALLDRLDSAIRVCLDTSHMALGRQWDRFLDVIGQRLAHVRASDHEGRFDDPLPPGEGTVDWDRVRRSLEQRAFDGWIVLDLSCKPALPPSRLEAVMRQTRALFAR